MKKKEPAIPILCIGNGELENNDTVHVGDSVICRTCGKPHKLTGSKVKNGDKWEPSELLLGYKCGKTSYLAAVNCKLLNGVKKARVETKKCRYCNGTGVAK